jgi:hypothetical protein
MYKGLTGAVELALRRFFVHVRGFASRRKRLLWLFFSLARHALHGGCINYKVRNTVMYCVCAVCRYKGMVYVHTCGLTYWL